MTRALVLAFLCLAACSTWHRPNTTEQQMKIDDYQCKSENRMRAVIDFIPVHYTDKGMYKRCMEIRGYTLE